MSRYKYPFIIKDSKQILHKISINENNDLVLEKFYNNAVVSKLVLKKNIINFAADIDDKDIIHLIYVDKSNRIRYSTYSAELIDNKYFNIKDENKDYRFLHLKFIKDRLYLFFIARPISDSQCILKSCIIRNNNLTTEALLTVSCSKYTCPYFIYFTTNFIYVLYSKDSNERYTIRIFDANMNRWYESLAIITLKQASHINFVVKNDIALICYKSFQNKKLEFLLTPINLKMSSKIINEQISLSNTNTKSQDPLILTFENHASILWEEDEKIAYFNMLYDESTMVKKQYVSIEKFIIQYANYRSNFYDTLKEVTTIAYTLNHNTLNIITDFHNIVDYKTKDPFKDIPNEVHKEISILDEISSDTESIAFTPMNIDFLEITPYLNNYIKELYSSTTNTSKLLSNYIEKNNKLKNENNYLTRLNSSYKSRIEDLKNRLIKYRNDSANVLIKYKQVIDTLENEKKEFLAMLEEKNSEISSLQHIMNSNEK